MAAVATGTGSKPVNMPAWRGDHEGPALVEELLEVDGGWGGGGGSHLSSEV